MDPYINQRKNDADQQLQNNSNMAPILDMIYQAYLGSDGIENEAIGRDYEKIENCLRHMTFQQKDEILCTVTEMCAEYERLAFLDGIRTGARLMMELAGI